MLGMGGRAPLPFALDHLPALARRLAVDPAAASGAPRASREVPRPRPPFALCRRRLSPRGGVGGKILVAHNGADPLPDGLPRRCELARRDRPIAALCGPAECARRASTRSSLSPACGPTCCSCWSARRATGRSRPKPRGLPMSGSCPGRRRRDLPAWLAAADVLLIPPSRAPLEQFRNCVLPLKLFAYLAAGKPILAPRAPDTAELLVDGEKCPAGPARRPGRRRRGARPAARRCGTCRAARRRGAGAVAER